MAASARDAVCVLVPRSASSGQTVDSQLLAAASLALGFQEIVGPDRVAFRTSTGPVDPRALLSADGSARPSGRRAIHRLPQPVRTALGDARAAYRGARGRRVVRYDGFERERLGLVVQYHHRFQDLGLHLAARAGCPVVLRVEALEIAEEAEWGVRRPPGWGGLVSRLGEQRIIGRAPALAAVSEPLALALARTGVPASRIGTVPNGVDLDVFAPAEPVEPAVLRRHGLENRFLVGWAGSFRPYHGLGQVEALAQELNRRLPDATLCLLGSGPLRAPLEAVASRHPERVVCLPQVPQAQVPRWLSTFDVCLQLADPGAGDHYSPLKVLEYLGCARPVVAADVVPNGFLTHGTDALLVRPGDVEGVVSALECLHENADARLRLSRNARATARRHGSWRTAAESMWQLAEARHAEGGMPS